MSSTTIEFYRSNFQGNSCRYISKVTFKDILKTITRPLEKKRGSVRPIKFDKINLLLCLYVRTGAKYSGEKIPI